MDNLIHLKDRFDTILLHAKALLPEHSELIGRLSFSLKFGHVDGFSGWTETVEEWSNGLTKPAHTLEALATRSLSRAVTSYALALKDLAHVGQANASLDALEDLLQAGQETQVPRIDLSAPSALAELSKHLADCRAVKSSPSIAWYVNWMEEGAHLSSELERTSDPIYALGILDAVVCGERPLFMIKTGSGYSEVRQRHGETIQLFMRILQAKDFEVLCPLPQEDSIDFSVHELHDQAKTGWGAKVGRVVKPGLSRNGRVIRKAVVEPLEVQLGGSVTGGSQGTAITEDMFKSTGSQ